MTFWGVEVKPGKPYYHSCDNDRRRLRITQATLGNGKGNNKSTLQVNVGDKRPIIICSLVPNVLETSHLELEFDEDEEVIFSVLGQISIHLCGYFVGGFGHKLDGDDDIESFGEDIANTDGSSDHKGSDFDDEYESDFIDDADTKVLSPAHRRKSSEEIIENDKPSKDKTNHRRIKRKHQMSDSDDDTQAKPGKPINSIFDIDSSDDEDDMPITFLSKKLSDVTDSGVNLGLTSDEEEANEDNKEEANEDNKKRVDTISQLDKNFDLTSNENEANEDAAKMDNTMSQADKSICMGTDTSQRTIEKSKKKKKRKNEEETTLASPSIAEKEETEPLQNQIAQSKTKDNDGKTKDETRKSSPITEKTRTEHDKNQVAESDKNENHAKTKKKKKGKKEKNPEERLTASENNKMDDQNPSGSHEPENLAINSELFDSPVSPGKANIELVPNLDSTSNEKEANEDDKKKIDTTTQVDRTLDLTSSEKEADMDAPKITDTVSQVNSSTSMEDDTRPKNSENSKKKKKNKEELTLASPTIVEKEETDPSRNQIAGTDKNKTDEKIEEKTDVENDSIIEKAKNEHGKTKKKKKSKKEENPVDPLNAADNDDIDQNPPANHEDGKLKKSSKKRATEDRDDDAKSAGVKQLDSKKRRKEHKN